MATQNKPEQDKATAAAAADGAGSAPGSKPAGRPMVTVRLSHRPDEEIEVPEGELPQLRNEGLLIEDKPAAKAPSGATARQ